MRRLPRPLSMRALKYRVKVSAAKLFPFRLFGGPLGGMTALLSGDASTLPIVIKGQAGRYVNQKWEPIT